jgi:hypothetical protein
MASSAKKVNPPRGKKGIRAALLQAGAELKAKYPKRTRPLVCALCGEAVPRGKLLEHKEAVHAEKSILRSPVQPHDPNRWVSVVGGGLPSLGKRRR